MKIVKWSFLTSSEWGLDHPECIKPLLPAKFDPYTNLSKEVISSRKGATFLKCPAHTDFIRNTFVFHAPFDLTIDINVNNESGDVRIFCENISQGVFDTMIDTRFLLDSDRGSSPYPLVGIDWLSVFQADEPMLMQALPATMHYNDFTSKAAIIPGEFDISKWTRPVEIVFEVRNTVERIEIKKGDALAYFKFHCTDIVKLEMSETPWPEMNECNKIRNANKFRPLKERYESLEQVRQGKCPYNPNE